MKKLILGVVALGVMVNVAWAIFDGPCATERMYYASCLKYEAGETRFWEFCQKGGGDVRKAKMKLEACLVQNGLY